MHHLQFEIRSRDLAAQEQQGERHAARRPRRRARHGVCLVVTVRYVFRCVRCVKNAILSLNLLFSSA